MQVMECSVPSGSMITRDLVGNSYFDDAYRCR